MGGEKGTNCQPRSEEMGSKGGREGEGVNGGQDEGEAGQIEPGEEEGMGDGEGS